VLNAYCFTAFVVASAGAKQNQKKTHEKTLSKDLKNGLYW
jgi:hypothetical protein